MRLKRQNGYWTKDLCAIEAIKYKTRGEFKRKFQACYYAAINNGWLEDVSKHMIEIKKPNGYWTLDRCKNEALKYETISEWKMKSKCSYFAAYKNMWSKECVSHMKLTGNKFKRLIYAYEFSDKSAYIGLTYNMKKRNNQHFSNHNISSVYNHHLKTGIKPKLILLTNYLNVDLAKIKEEEFLEKYKNEGWEILNKIKTGGLGGNKIKWTKEECIIDAKKYETKKEWNNNSTSCYVSAYMNGWLNECTKHMIPGKKPNGYWTLERCIEDAKKYKTKVEWQKKSKVGYEKAYKMKWLNECCKNMLKIKKPNDYWTLERCIEDAKGYKTKGEWEINSSAACTIARKNKWSDKCCGHMISSKLPNGFWTKARCIEDAKKYNTRNKWQRNGGTPYSKARKNNWLNECCSHMINGRKLRYVNK